MCKSGGLHAFTSLLLTSSIPTLEFQTAMEKLVEVSEQEIRIDFTLGCKCRANVHLRSLSATTPIAFKVQTSSPHKFLVNPPSGLIPPLSYATFQVILKPQTQLPPSFPRSPSDRFLIKTAPTTDFNHSAPPLNPESVNSWFSSRTHLPTYDLKLKIAYVGLFLLRRSISVGDIDAVKSIIKRQKSILSELSIQESESLLRIASESCMSDNMIDFLLENGLKTDVGVNLDNVNAEEDSKWESNSKGWTQIHVAAALNEPDKISRLIEESCSRGDSLDCRDREGRTPLHLSASKGNVRCAKVLVDAGAEVNAKSNDGRTALYMAATIGSPQMVALLMEMGADPTITTAVGARSPLDVAIEKGHNEVVEILEQGESVLTAARKGELQHLELLLRKGARVNHCDQYGLTTLHAAAIKGHRDAVSMLIEFGMDLECQDAEGHTALHLAVEGGNIETVEVLVNKGANVDAKTKSGATPLFMAEALGYDDISQFLLNRGASPQPYSSSLSSML